MKRGFAAMLAAGLLLPPVAQGGGFAVAAEGGEAGFDGYTSDGAFTDSETAAFSGAYRAAPPQPLPQANVFWVAGAFMTAGFDKVPGAAYYYVRLYKADDTQVGLALRMDGAADTSSIDLRPLIDAAPGGLDYEDGEYYFTVEAAPENSNESTRSTATSEKQAVVFPNAAKAPTPTDLAWSDTKRGTVSFRVAMKGMATRPVALKLIRDGRDVVYTTTAYVSAVGNGYYTRDLSRYFSGGGAYTFTAQALASGGALAGDAAVSPTYQFTDPGRLGTPANPRWTDTGADNAWRLNAAWDAVPGAVYYGVSLRRVIGGVTRNPAVAYIPAQGLDTGGVDLAAAFAYTRGGDDGGDDRYTIFESGTYTFTVQAVGQAYGGGAETVRDGAESQPSAPKVVTIPDWPKANAPTNLAWSEEALGGGTFDKTLGGEGYYAVILYKDGQAVLERTLTGLPGGVVEPMFREWVESQSLGEAAGVFESGVYTFKAKALGRYGVSADSDWSAPSPPYNYTIPTAQVPAPASARWKTGEALTATWNPVSGVKNYAVALYREKANNVRSYVTAWHGVSGTRFDFLADGLVLDLKDGPYGFSVRALSEDVAQAAHSDWAESDLYIDTSDVVRDAQARLSAIDQGASAAAILAAVKDVTDDTLAAALKSGDTAAANALAGVEAAYRRKASVGVGVDAAYAQSEGRLDGGGVSVLGAGFNAAPGENLTLKFSAPQPAYVFTDTAQRRTISVEIDLVNDLGEKKTGVLAVPIQVTMPIPNGFDPDRIYIIHYLTGGGQERIWPLTDGAVMRFTLESLSPVVFAMDIVSGWRVSFDLNGGGGDSILPQRVSDGGIAYAPDRPTKAGFGFVGWYADAPFTTKWDFKASAVSEDKTLYARWARLGKLTGGEGGAGVTDARRLLQGVSQKDLTDVEKAAADFYGSGRVGVGNARLLLQHVLNPQKYPLR